jgi:hypothetical protein
MGGSRWNRRLGLFALWLFTAWMATTTRTLIPPSLQDEATTAASLILAGFMAVILVREAPSIARTLRAWRDQL